MDILLLSQIQLQYFIQVCLSLQSQDYQALSALSILFKMNRISKTM